jgi:hypothetical protein
MAGEDGMEGLPPGAGGPSLTMAEYWAETRG